MKYFFLLLLAAMSAVASEGYQTYYYREPFPVFEGKKIVRHGLWDPKPPQFEDLKKAYADKKYKNYPEFVKYLFDKEPAYKDRFVLIHHSESQQMGSFASPRVVVYRGSTMMGLSDYEGQSDRRVEMIQAKKDSFDLEFKEIIFNDQGVEFRDNPKACLTCHGSPAKPLWAPYGQWAITTYGDPVLKSSSKELAEFKKLTQSPKSPVLSKLNLGDGNYTDKIWGFSNTAMNLFFRNWFGKNLSKERLSVANGWRLIHSLNCIYSNGLESFLKNPEVRKIDHHFAQNADANIEFTSAFQKQVALERMGTSDFAYFVPQNNDARARVILEYLGIETANFTPSLNLLRYDTRAPGYNLRHMTSVLYELRPDIFEKISWEPGQLSFDPQLSLLNVDCDSLNKMVSSLPIDPPITKTLPSFTEVDQRLPVMTRCLQCHVTHASDPDKRAPLIPFNDSIKLSQMLKDPNLQLKQKILSRVTSHGTDQMPPNQGLTATEIESMKEFLENLE